MSRLRLHVRVTRLEVQWRPAVIAEVLWRVRQCVPADLGACLMAELIVVDRAMCEAIMDHLTDMELEALIGLEASRLMEMLSEGELEALASGDPAATWRFQQSLQRWKDGHS